MNAATPTIIPTGNSNGIRVSNLVYDNDGQHVTATIKNAFSGVVGYSGTYIDPFPFTVGDKVLVENASVGVGSTAYFSQVSRIVASSHTFEYVGSGNDITTATPKRGGVTIQANEVVTTNGGKVVYTSTDQAGNFRIGDQLQINQNTGTISGRAFSKSLFSEITPFILALS